MRSALWPPPSSASAAGPCAAPLAQNINATVQVSESCARWMQACAARPRPASRRWSTRTWAQVWGMPVGTPHAFVGRSGAAHVALRALPFPTSAGTALGSDSESREWTIIVSRAQTRLSWACGRVHMHTRTHAHTQTHTHTSISSDLAPLRLWQNCGAMRLSVHCSERGHGGGELASWARGPAALYRQRERVHHDEQCSCNMRHSPTSSHSASFEHVSLNT